MDINFQGLTRTSSFTDLSSARKLIFQQVTASDGLVKHYSCEQIFDKNSNVRQVKVSTLITSAGKPQSEEIWTTSFPRVSSCVKNPKSSSLNKLPMQIKEKSEPCHLPALNLSLLQISDDSRRGTSCELKKHRRSRSSYDDRRRADSPLSVRKPALDMNVSKDPELKVQGDSKNKEAIEDLKKIRPLAQEFTVMPARSTRSVKLLFFGLVALSVLIISSLITEIYEPSFDFRNASLELSRKIYGQDLAVVKLSEYFQENSLDFKVVALVGGTGVGKTYAGKIIKKHFPHTHNIYEYIPPLADVIPEAYDILSALHSNLVVLENLRLKDLQDFVYFVRYFFEQKNRPKVIILAMINPETVDNNLRKSLDLEMSIRIIQEAFLKVDVPVKTVAFQPLGPEGLEACVREEARKLNFKINDLQVEEVKKSIISSQSGCKGAYAKVQLYVK
ncbi:GSCOCG00003962001-RA-CDS [Cotesia congregata]|uniref:Uncharacterized protein n=1 Tax=Cotesia congregata TaxID=51543 RepID=A0A8J2MK87_COTCN|nr:GSCOCG00003962001-RA-CDS [Cotesia congregata]CAG5081698.1 Protein of unknown function [Cotesia congregata]